MTLHALGDAPPPPTLAGDLATLRGLPSAARQRFWEALGPSLKDPLPPEIEATLDRFARETAAPANDLARAIRGSRFLVREAVKRSVSQAALAADLKALLPEDEEVPRILLAGYGKARDVLVGDALGRSLLDHGKVARALAWRVEDVAASHRGEALAGRVAVVTLRLATPAGGEEIVTFHATAEHARSFAELGAALQSGRGAS